MKTAFLSIVFALSFAFQINAQSSNSDVLFMADGQELEVIVKKVEPKTITYHFVGEELENVVEKSAVQKIIFKSGREQQFSNATLITKNTIRSASYEYPAMNETQGAVLPFEFIFDGVSTPEEGFEAQEYYYNNLMRKPERNTISYQDTEITTKRLRAAGIIEANDMRDYDMAEIAKIVGAGILVTGKITVDYRSTTSTNSGSTTTKVDTKKKRVKTYSSESTYSKDEFNTKVLFKIYDKDGNKVVDVKRIPFMATTRNNYITALNFLMKRTPYYQKK